MTSKTQPFEFLDFDQIDATPCPCGFAKRGLMESDGVPFSLHVTEITLDAKAHYHKKLTETYFVLECGTDAQIELDGELYPLAPHKAVVIYPGTRHRAIGSMKVAIIAYPKFDPSDEWFD